MYGSGGCGLLLMALVAAPALGSEPAPLPAAELTEPFAIGEALFDPSRVEQGVVSLVARMGMELDDSLVRGLVRMGQDDLANAKGDRLPWSFRDLHAAVHPMLPELTAAQLAEQYTKAYAAGPESLAAQVLLGMPLEANTPLTRPQIWFLLVDGFAPSAVSPKLAQLGPADESPAGGAGYGTASLTLQQLPSPIPGLSLADFHRLVAVLPMLSFGLPFDVQPLPVSAHEGHGGPGTTAVIEARIGAQAQPPVGPSGAVLLQPLAGRRDDRMVFWELRDRAVIEKHGSFDIPAGTPSRTDLHGVARIRFSPKPEGADGRGVERTDTASIAARIAQWDLLSLHYDIPPALRGMALGDRSAPGAMIVAWHEDGIRIRIENQYHAGITFGFLGGGIREGTDVAEGVIAEQADGTWAGTVDASVDMTQMLQGVGGSTACPKTRFRGTQKLRVRGYEATGWSDSQSITFDAAAGPGQRSGKYLALEFDAAEDPSISPSGPCLDLYQRDPQSFRFLPLNDARWTLPQARYVIELPEKGLLVWKDDTTKEFHDSGLSSLGMVAAISKWNIRVEKPEPP